MTHLTHEQTMEQRIREQYPKATDADVKEFLRQYRETGSIKLGELTFTRAHHRQAETAEGNYNDRNCGYLSLRGHLLLYVDPTIDRPIITLDNYTKWYEISLIHPDGSVTSVDYADIDAVQRKDGRALWRDHLYHPRLLWRLGEHLNADVCERAVEVAAGRWMIEAVDHDDYLFVNPAIAGEDQGAEPVVPKL